MAFRATQLKKHLSIQGNRSVISIHSRAFSNTIFSASTFFLFKEACMLFCPISRAKVFPCS
ncbi:hypothetical protein QW060_09350 [Myroides ceti]|uniref:Uncharacterized protein n=1 Tax=Paenimyroides ceti TaxID=395087 RepID=A0ABT8CTL2_9FLAO|nr:hypothetical protein [Paenimyroides ceti]MDN3707341.1 hypothetical protein [Paenimyroides ceti]